MAMAEESKKGQVTEPGPTNSSRCWEGHWPESQTPGSGRDPASSMLGNLAQGIPLSTSVSSSV